MFYGPNRRWITLTAKLPNAMQDLRSVTVNNRVFITGKKIFEWNRNSPVWNIVLIFYILWHRRNFTVHSIVKCDIQCSHSEYFLGGYMRYISKTKTYITSKKILVFDPWNNKTWQKEIDMETGRYMHAVSVLPNIWSFCGN